MKKKVFNIEFNTLIYLFPIDTIWVKVGAELVGLSKSEKLHIVIDDGCCCDDEGKWLVNVYKIKDIEQHWNDFFPNETRDYFFKYPSNGEEEKLIEEWVDFYNWDNLETLRNKIVSGKCYIEQWDDDYLDGKCLFCTHYKSCDVCFCDSEDDDLL